jgi:cytoplasmic iron level regulating protein YaaA (DUF328/UPF0246 family)
MIIIPSAKRQNQQSLKIYSLDPKLILPDDIDINLNNTLLSADKYRAYELYDGTIMREFKNLVKDDKFIKTAIKEVKFISPQFGIIDFDQPIKPYRLSYQDKVNGKTVISIWKNYYKNYSFDNECILDLSTNQTAPFFKDQNVIRIELTKFGMKINHGKKLKAKILFHIIENIINKREKLSKIESTFEGLLIIKY